MMRVDWRRIGQRHAARQVDLHEEPELHGIGDLAMEAAGNLAGLAFDADGVGEYVEGFEEELIRARASHGFGCVITCACGERFAQMRNETICACCADNAKGGGR